MPLDAIVKDSDDRMNKALEVLTGELRGIRTGRATPALVENVKVSYYGTPTPLKQIAGISVPDPRMIVIKPFDPGSLGDIERGIHGANLGINPTSDGKVIRLAMPALSEEQRKKFAAHVKELGEKARVAVRNVRRDANKLVETDEKKGALTEDEAFKAKEKIQDLVKGSEKKVDEIVEKKTKELFE